MLREMEPVIFIYFGKEHDGIALGCEKDYFWVFVPDLKCVYVGHPSRILKHEGKKFFEVFDHSQTTDKMFHGNGEVKSYLFDYSQDPERMIKIMKMHWIVGAL